MSANSVRKARTPRWKRRPEARPAQIIEAALDVFGQKGLANARLEDIAARAGVSKGTIYLYFANKEALFREMIRETAIAAIERGEQRPATGSPTEQLTLIMQRYWEFIRSQAFSTIHRLVIGELGVWCDKRDCLPVLEGRDDDQIFADIRDFYLRSLLAAASASAQADGA